jgi:glycosyltransferase involved in cell wall biosynthesis
VPLCAPIDGGRRYEAVVAVAACDASGTIVPALASIVESIRFHAARRGAADRIAVSVVDDASSDETADIVASFGRAVDVDVYLAVNETNRGRGRSRNRALAAVDADCYLFLDHDDEYLPEHIAVCLETLAGEPRADFVKTGVRLSDPVHPDWEPRIAASLTQNFCIRSYCHRIVGGFHEEPEIETYGCDDLLYNRVLRAYLRGIDIPRTTVKFLRRPGNSFDRQYERKFARPAALAEVTLSPVQLSVQDDVWALHHQRLRDVKTRMRRLAAMTRGMRRLERRS